MLAGAVTCTVSDSEEIVVRTGEWSPDSTATAPSAARVRVSALVGVEPVRPRAVTIGRPGESMLTVAIAEARELTARTCRAPASPAKITSTPPPAPVIW